MAKKKQQQPPEKILCGNPAHGIPRKHLFIAEHFRVSASEADPALTHHDWQVGPPHGTFSCPACDHFTERHREAQP
jgi:hypothetical protein